MSRRVWLALWLALAGCASAPPPFDPYDNTEVLRAALAKNAHLAGLGLDTSINREGKSTSFDLQARVKVEPLADGYAAVLATAHEEVSWSDASRGLGLVRGGSGGVHTLAVVAARSVLVPLGDEAVVVVCSVNEQNAGFVSKAYLSDAAAGFVELAADPVDCGTSRAGRAVAPNQALVVINGSLARWSVNRASRVLTQAYSDAPPVGLAAAGTLLFVDEPAAGEVAFVLLNGGVLTYHRGTLEWPTSAVAGLDGAVGVRRGADGALRVVTPQGLWRWGADTLEVPVELAPAPAPPATTEWRVFGDPWVASAWTAGPNPLNPEELYPTAALVRIAGESGFDSFAPSATPCCDPEACRLAAESYVIGAAGEGAVRGVFYDLWTWVGFNEHALVVAGPTLECLP